MTIEKMLYILIGVIIVVNVLVITFFRPDFI